MLEAPAAACLSLILRERTLPEWELALRSVGSRCEVAMDISHELLTAQSASVSIVTGIPGVRSVDVGLREQDGAITDEIVLRALVSDLENVPPEIRTEISGIPITIIQRNPQVEWDLSRYPTLVGNTRRGDPPLATNRNSVNVG